MSLFRKPKRIQRRVFCVDDDDDGEPEPPPPPVISHAKKENKPVKSTPLLSFADEGIEDGEVFIVKKSSQSKRLAKRRDREKRRANDSDNNKYDNHSNNEEKDSPVSADNQEKNKPKKKKASLEGLILSGREALAADGTGDVSGSEEEAEEPEEDNRGFHRYRADTVRAALAVAPGHIPDAALIHAARKTRQQARECGDVIPVPSEAAPGSRLQRDDGSGDDEEEGRLLVRGLDLPSDKPKRGTAAASADSELDSEGEEWAAQQLNKARGAIVDGLDGTEAGLNPFAVAPPPPRLQEAPAHLRPLAAPAQPPPATPQALLDALTDRLQELETDRSSTLTKKETCSARLEAAAATRSACGARTGALDAAYRRAQAARGFLTDLIECLDEKLPLLEALEARALALHRRRCEFLTERRRADVQDQALDTLAPARAGALKPADSEEKIRRTAEREGRRRARRLKREAAAAAAGAPPPRSHRDGDSSDDDLPPSEEHYYRQEKESIRAAAAAVFADALPAWRSARGVCARLARWRRRDPTLYADAYVADCLPKLIAPYVRHQLILWNPLADEDNEDYERMDWYKWLMMYGVRNEKLSSESEQSSDEESGGGGAVTVSEDGVRADPDLMLVPAVVCGVVLPKLAEVVDAAWDPVCVRACVRLRQLLVRACALPGAAPAVARVASAARARLQRALNADVFLPPLPINQALDGASGAFWRRCLGAGVRLLRAALALTSPPPLLRADDVALSLIETLSTAAGACAGPAAAAAAAALAETLPRGTGELRARALRRLARLAALAINRLDQANPLHMKAVEQAKAVIAEAKTSE
ncbi:PAX3- and PAX7-binding protein 1 isoform X4 [Cydia pomonella]|uniref:PAX3- and PAX7-binding protein 1 isoform X4 n=1 Tax=Cydia pomonella TaxID=82600 RepID=UPI002ADE7E1C|nr:PAX3- and PAX7-binding protein 1 isoform X4 [Cydia pomonella]